MNKPNIFEALSSLGNVAAMDQGHAYAHGVMLGMAKMMAERLSHEDRAMFYDTVCAMIAREYK